MIYLVIVIISSICDKGRAHFNYLNTEVIIEPWAFLFKMSATHVMATKNAVYKCFIQLDNSLEVP